MYTNDALNELNETQSTILAPNLSTSRISQGSWFVLSCKDFVRHVLLLAISFSCLLGGCKSKQAYLPEHTFGMEAQSSDHIVIKLADSGEQIEVSGAEMTPILNAFLIENCEFLTSKPPKEAAIAELDFMLNQQVLDSMKYYPNSILTCRSKSNDRPICVRFKQDPIAPLLQRK